MINLALSEPDFEYELQALVNSFFPGQKSRTCVFAVTAPMLREEVETAVKPLENPADFSIGIFLGKEKIGVSFLCEETQCFLQKEVSVAGGDDWHKHEDKSAHPYRTYYKNELKRLLFCLLKELKQEELPAGTIKRIPVWGTMTGVRPTKIPMNELLKGKPKEVVEEDLEKWYCCTEEKKKLCLDIAMREAELLKDVAFEAGYSLYIGIPFCPTTCLYCSFPSYPFGSFGHLADKYLQALKKEITAVAKQCRNRKLTSIYMGGGTPTTLTAEQMDELLACIRNCFPMENSYEFTVEAGRPDSITEEKLAVLRKYGVERISVNPQTMQQKTLDLIGRRHTVEDTKKAFYMARDAGFTNINMDLIIGLPRETVTDFADTLSQIKELNPDSITVHSLVIKRASRLRSVLEESYADNTEAAKLKGVVDSMAAERLRNEQMEKMLAMAAEFAKKEGYQPYYMYRQKNSAGHYGSSGQENIGYAREGKACLYNILIMEEMQTIAACGAGASTKRYHEDKKIVSRIENVKSITDYIERIDEMIARKKEIFV